MNQLSLEGFITNEKLCRELQTQGQQAVKSGQAAEDTIYCILRERGYRVERQKHIGQSIYGSALYADFYVTGIAMFADGLIIESKWQETPGSVDEKFPYLDRNIKERYPCPAIVICDGGGAKAGAVGWLKQQVDGAKLYAVFSFQEFLAWSIRNL